MKNLTTEATPGQITIPWYIAIIITISAIFLIMLITYLIFLSSTYVIKVLGKKGMDAFTRVMGLLTVAIAIQFMFTALESWLQVNAFLVV